MKAAADRLLPVTAAALSHGAIYLSGATAHLQHAERDCALQRLSSV